MRVQPLDQFATVVLNATGQGVASLGPTRVKEHWQPISVFVSVDTQVLEATAALFVGTTFQSATQMGTTSLGSNGDTCGTPGLELPAGYQIFIQWTGGDAGSTATMHVIGQTTFGYS